MNDNPFKPEETEEEMQQRHERQMRRTFDTRACNHGVGGACDRRNCLCDCHATLTVADIRAIQNAGIPFMTEAGFEALKRQLRGEKS